ncbi:MAG: HAMP domain-containing sensor histidine kinase [Polyangiaceae bacterium]
MPRLTLWFLLSIAVLLSARGFLRVRQQSQAFDLDMQRDHRFIGRGLAAAAGDVWRVDGSARAQRLVEVAGQTEDASIALSWLSERSLGREPVADADLRSALDGREVQRFDAEHLRSYFPVRAGDAVGALLVSESLAERDRHLYASVIHALLSLAFVLGCCGGLAILLSRWIVARPVELLIDKARRVGRGDFSAPLSFRRRDEFQSLALEMNAMCDALAQAKEEVASETRAHQLALEQLRHADRLSTVGKLAAGVAHELGTPLSIVSGHAEMIANREVLGEKVIDSAKIIDCEARRIAGIVRSLLGFARRKGPEGGTCDVAAVASSSIALFQPMAEKALLSLDLEAAADCRATIDQDSLQQVMTNLLSNAIQAMGKGGAIQLKVSAEIASLPKDLERAPRTFVRLDVTDSGPGIAAEVLPHIFEPFFSTKSPGEGTGLGLSVVYGIVEDHRGFISVETEAGKGSRFSVFLPAAGAP